MKRRSETSPRDHPTLRSSSVRGFNGVRNPQFRADAARNKRVKFNEHETDLPLCNEPTASSERPRGFDAPKTSEYAFFKKLKKNAGCRSSVIREGDENLKTFEPSGTSTRVEPSLLRQADFTTKVKDNFDKIRSSIPHEKAMLNPGNFFSSPQNAWKSMEAVRVIENSHNNDSPPFLAKRVNFTDQNLFASPLGHSSERPDSEDLDGDMFSQKRKRLRQWVAETSGPAVEELCSKGYDLVSALLTRLFPDGDQSNYNRDEEVKPMSSATKYSADELTEVESLSYSGDFCAKPREIIPLNLDLGLSDSPSTGQYLSDKFLLEDSYDRRSRRRKRRYHIEADHAWYWDDKFNETRETIPLNLDTRISNSSSGCQAHFPYEYNKSHLSCDDRSTSFLALHEPNYFSDVDGPSTLSHIKERNEFYSLDESDNRRRSSVMLLDWGNSQDNGDLSHTACDKEMNLLSSPIALSYDSHLSPRNSYGVRESHSILFNSDSRSEVTLCPYSHLEKLNWDSRLFQEDNMLVVKPKQHLLPLRYVPECPEEDCSSYIPFEANGGISLQHKNCVVSKFFSEKHHSQSKPLLSGRGLDTYRTCLSSNDLLAPQKESIRSYLLTDEQDNFLEYSQNTGKSLYAEDTINILEWPSLDLHKPPKKEIVRPFLLNSSSSWGQSEEDNYYDGD